MPQNNLPTPTLTLSIKAARRFMLAHHNLWPPRSLKGKAGVMEYFQRVGSIQYDPINVVGRNADLVLQARIRDYDPRLLENLLYEDRRLVDYWDKVMCIFSVADWPLFAHHRTHMGEYSKRRSPEAQNYTAAVIQELKARGPLSSIDFDHDKKVDWAWGPTRAARAALESLYNAGELIVHHKVGTRRVYDLAENHIPADLLNAPSPNQTEEEYQRWHILRRMGSLGLASPMAGEHWQMILGVKSRQRQAILHHLVDTGEAIPLEIAELPDQTFFIRSADLPTLESVQNGRAPRSQAAIVGALDNLMWSRELMRRVFDFDYVWEIYKPKEQRLYGYYVLPVIYGDRFVARFDPAFDKKAKVLIIQNWWWEENVSQSKAMQSALARCFRAFVKYLDANDVQIDAELMRAKQLNWFLDL